MADTHGVGRLYVTHTQYPELPAPLLEKGWTQESEEPFRVGTSLVLRLPMSRRALVLGWWRSQDEDMGALFTPVPVGDWNDWS